MTVVGLSFGDRLQTVFDRIGRLCIGIDPHRHLLAEWELSDTAAGALDLGRRVIDAAIDNVGIVKPQVAFFERFGAAGYRALETLIAEARSAGLLVIADVKRGDIGTTVDAYAEAWLATGSPLESDAMTISAFQGVGSIDETMRFADSAGKGLFVLAATSNSEAELIQRASVEAVDSGIHRTVSRAIIDDVAAFNLAAPQHALGSIGLVIGATLDLARWGIDTTAPVSRNASPILAPGFGHQGARIHNIRSIFGTLATSVIVSESRGVLSAGPDRIGEAVKVRADDVRNALG
jgi:orotidine-5'-phosphate decarboxylase